MDDNAVTSSRYSQFRNILVSVFILLSFTQQAISQVDKQYQVQFDEIWHTVNDNFYDVNFNGVNWQQAGDEYRNKLKSVDTQEDFAALVNELLAELNTSHTYYFIQSNPRYYELLDIFSGVEEIKKLSPEGEVLYTTIGIVSKDIDGKTYIEDILDGSPASQVNLKVGDEILQVDDQSFYPIKSFEGKADTEVSIQVQRTIDPASQISVNVTPIEINPGALFRKSLRKSAEIVSSGDYKIGYVRIRSYAGEKYQNILTSLVTTGGKLEKADALVLDIRGSWGGANPENLNLFNRKVPSLEMIQRDGTGITFNPQWKKPVVLLIDETCRSGKEILAYGFKKYNIGPTVGARTAGAVVGGRVFPLSDGSVLYLAVVDARVDGDRLEGNGVTPDFEVERIISYSNGQDPQLQKAIEIAVKEITDS